MYKRVNRLFQSILIILSLAGLNNSALSQDYSTVPRGLLFYEPEEKLPINLPLPEEKYISGIKVIDTIISESDTFFHFQFEKLILDNNKGPSLFGKGIEKRTDGSEVFFNIADEEIKILPKAKLDSTWILWENSVGEYIEAKIIQTELQTVLGETDSVKLISLTHYYSNGNKKDSRVNELEIHLSKNHGLSKIFNIREFPFIYKKSPYVYFEERLYTYNLIGNTSKKVGLRKPMIKDIFDFQINDLIRYYESADIEGSMDYTHDYILTINECNLSRGGDSLWLEKEVRMHFNHDDSNPYIDTLKEWIERINSPIITYLENYPYNEDYTIDLPLEIFPSYNFLDFGYVLFRNEQYGGRFQVILFPSEFGLHLWETDHKSMLTWGGDYYHMIYGCGSYYTYAYSEGYGGILHKEKLIYFKKGEEEWGIPLSNHETQRLNNKNLMIFPNPVIDHLKMDLRDIKSTGKMSYKIYNSAGILILEEEIITGPEFRIDCRNLSPGVYCLVVAGDKIYSGKFIKQ